MSKRKMSTHILQHSIKYKTKEEAQKEVKRIKSIIEYNAKKNNWIYRASVGISNVAAFSGIWIKDKKGTAGRPVYRFEPYEYIIRENIDYNRDYHIHILLEGIPGSTISNYVQYAINKQIVKELGHANCLPKFAYGSLHLRYIASQDPIPKIWGSDDKNVFGTEWKEIINNYRTDY